MFENAINFNFTNTLTYCSKKKKHERKKSHRDLVIGGSPTYSHRSSGGLQPDIEATKERLELQRNLSVQLAQAEKGLQVRDVSDVKRISRFGGHLKCWRRCLKRRFVGP